MCQVFDALGSQRSKLAELTGQRLPATECTLLFACVNVFRQNITWHVQGADIWSMLKKTLPDAYVRLHTTYTLRLF